MAQVPAPMSFSDLPASHQAYSAVQYLSSHGILQGYNDGTFRPDKKVTRAEAIKIIAASIAQGKIFTPGTSAYADIPAGVWYEPYVTFAWKELGIIDGPPTATMFHGERTVTTVEFLKILLLAHKVDPQSYSEIQLHLSSDVTDPAAWYYPYVRYALSSSILSVQENGTLNPAQQLSRAQVALFLHSFLTYKEGRQTQNLLSSAETDLVNTLKMLDEKHPEQAEFASARALLAARGAHTSHPDVPLVQGALKITQAFRALVRAYKAGSEGSLDNAISLSKEAWALAEEAKAKSAELLDLSLQVQGIAQNMAETARQGSSSP